MTRPTTFPACGILAITCALRVLSYYQGPIDADLLQRSRDSQCLAGPGILSVHAEGRTLPLTWSDGLRLLCEAMSRCPS